MAQAAGQRGSRPDIVSPKAWNTLKRVHRTGEEQAADERPTGIVETPPDLAAGEPAIDYVDVAALYEAVKSGRLAYARDSGAETIGLFTAIVNSYIAALEPTGEAGPGSV